MSIAVTERLVLLKDGAVSGSYNDVVSQAIDMPNLHTHAQPQVVFEIARGLGGLVTTGITVTVEGSVDLENWTSVGSTTMTATRLPAISKLAAQTVQSYAYVRLRYRNLNTWKTVLINASIETYRQA